jgi:hypothetical protein
MGDGELAALVKGVLADLDGAGALADFLQEHDRAKEAVLLRRRWKAWQKDRGKETARARDTEAGIARPMLAAVESLRAAGFQCEASIHVKATPNTDPIDNQFRDYIRSRFAGVRVEDVSCWYAGPFRGYAAHAVVRVQGRFIYTACRSMIAGEASQVTVDGPVPKAICRKCRTALQTMTLRKPAPTAP